MDKKQPEPVQDQPPQPPWAAELPIDLADLEDFIRRHRIRGARVVVTDQGLALAYESEEPAHG
jgi:hypothetical protein